MSPRSLPARRPRDLVLLLVLVVAVLAALVAAGPVSRAGAGSSIPHGARTAPRPNIVMVMADDMRVDDLLFTPRLRRLVAHDGLTFENSFAPYPLCCPARASFLTGEYAHNHGVFWHEPPYGYGSFDDSHTLGTALKRAGYHTGFVGKYLNKYGVARSRVTGEPSWHYVPAGWSDWIAAFENPHVRGIHGDTYDYFDTPYNVNGHVDNRYRGRYQADVVGDFAVGLTRKYARSSRPFFMYVNFLAPHFGGPHERGDIRQVRANDGTMSDFRSPARPRWVRGRFDRVIRRGAGMPKNGGPSEADISDKPHYLSHAPEPNRAERAALTSLTRQRAEAVYVMDRQIARLVAELKRTGEWANTVFMFTSDNGYYLGEHRHRTGKVFAHEPSLRTPFLVTGPGLRGGQKRYDPISTVDITATIVDLAGAQPPHLADGTSRVDTMLHGDRGWTVPVVTEAAVPHRHVGHRAGFDDARTSIGLRTPRYSYIRNRFGESELYDLVRDPLEMRNVIDDDARRPARAELNRLWSQVKDCRGATCRTPLPADLSATPAGDRSMTRAYWAAVQRVYGW